MTCSCNFFTEAVEGLVFGVADRLEELGIRPVAAARVPAGAVAGLITGRGAAGRVKFGDGGPQADDGARIEARARRAVQDRGDGRGQFAGLLQHLRARVQLLLVTAHDQVLSLRSAVKEGDGCAGRAIRSPPLAKQGRERKRTIPANE
jgi:hypothetical protein